MKLQKVFIGSEIIGDVDIIGDSLESIRFSQGDNSMLLVKQERYVFTKEELQRFLTSVVASVAPPVQETQNWYDRFLKENELL